MYIYVCLHFCIFWHVSNLHRYTMDLYMKSCGVESSLFSGMLPAAGHSEFGMIPSPNPSRNSLYAQIFNGNG